MKISMTGLSLAFAGTLGMGTAMAAPPAPHGKVVGPDAFNSRNAPAATYACTDPKDRHPYVLSNKSIKDNFARMKGQDKDSKKEKTYVDFMNSKTTFTDKITDKAVTLPTVEFIAFSCEKVTVPKVKK